MSCAGMSKADIEAAITELEATKRKILTGGFGSKVAYGGVSTVSVEKLAPSIEQIEMELTRLRLALSKLTGCPSGVGPFRPGFGIRP